MEFLLFQTKNVEDSIKTLTASVGGLTVTWMEILPVAVRVLVGIATFVYICVKIYKEIYR